tara:strand:- start:136 stop:516 length:381 start_codon:yes stop_codon:yes gene_type:complete
MGSFVDNGRAKYFLILVCSLPVITLFGWIFWTSITDTRTSGERYLDSKSDMVCSGTIDSIYREKMNHNILALKTKSCVFDVPFNWENNFNLGDSISKKKGHLHVEHYREGKLLEVLDYREIAKTLK